MLLHLAQRQQDARVQSMEREGEGALGVLGKTGAHSPCPLSSPLSSSSPLHLPLLSQTFYAISFLMVVVYAFESYRMVRGWRARHMAALQVSVPFPSQAQPLRPCVNPGS